MLQPSSTPPRPEFTPRREFIREQRSPPNVFALIAIASSSFIRLYSFPPVVAAALHRLFDDHQICLTFRQVALENFYEFTLDGKPWANAKSVTTEKLLVDIIAVIYEYGYTYLSNLDYGRDVDDLLIMAFSLPSSSSTTSREGTPVPPPDSSSGCSPDRHRHHRVPFALSFTSATCMRVISPPLHLTPAILQAVRGAWPRGVVSEKKVGDNSFEFKLKGYKWFQQDTFATDSFRHILALLSSLDAQSFTLLSSISLKNRSRVKDLWVFTGVASPSTDDLVHPEPSPLNTPNLSHADPRRPLQSPEGPFRPYPIVNHGFTPQHRRLATEPIIPAHVSSSQPLQVISENHPNEFHSSHRREDISAKAFSSPSLLRKPAPRAQVPVSVINEAEATGAEGVRANLPSIISSTAENMTGIGTSGFFPEMFHVNPVPTNMSSNPRLIFPTKSFIIRTPSPDDSPSASTIRTGTPSRSTSTREKAPPMLVDNAGGSLQKHPSPTNSYVPSTRKISSSSTHATPTSSYGVRDSAFSSSRHASLESYIPSTAVTNATTHDGYAGEVRQDHTVSHVARTRRQSRQGKKPKQPGISPPPSPDHPRRIDSPVSLDKQGWVLVDVNSGRETVPVDGWFPMDARHPVSQTTRPVCDPGPISKAKGIAAMDAIDASKSKGGAHQDLSSSPLPTSPMKRLFGLVRKTSKKGGSSAPRAGRLD